MATTTYLQNTHTGTGSNTGAKATMSVWVKRTDIAGDDRSTIIGARADDNNYFKIRFADNDRLMIYGARSSGVNVNIETDAEFRDVSGWYHIVLQIDTTSSTETERVKWYVNGELQTIRSSGRNYPDQNDVNYLTSASDVEIGRNAAGQNEHFDGSMSHFHMIDGTIYAPTAFGSTDSVTGEWQINTAPNVTYGAKGFFILKDGNSVTDASPNTNNFTVAGGTLTKTEDNPSNVFATLNPLSHFFGTAPTFSNGNNTVTTSSASGSINPSPATLGITSGKWYWEGKLVNAPSSNYALIGIMAQAPAAAGGQNFLGGVNDTYGYASWNGTLYNSAGSTGNTSGGATYTTGDILSIAVDADNNRLYYYKNGTIQNSGTGIVIPAAADTLFGAWLPAVGDWDTPSLVWSCNFGNGFFGTTAVSSAGTNASGNGIFEYNVPSGYTALSTKGLNL